MRFILALTFLSLLIPSLQIVNAITVSFSRRLDTCDTQDQPLSDGTTKFVYAYSSINPSTTGNQPTFHQKYGTRSARIMDEKPIEPPMPKDARHIDLLANNTLIPFPSRDPTTSYYCHLFAINVTSRAHIVKWEPVFSPPENKKYVHHILVYECTSALPSDVNFNELCDDLPDRLRHCLQTTAVSAWAVGGDAFNYPSNIGYPIGTEDTTRYVMMQTHYNNQARISPIIDSSGMRYTITEKHLRPIEAAVLMQGYNTDPHFTIPPGIKDYMYSAPCSSLCTNQLFSQPVKIFASLLHMHTVGNAITTRHIRNGIELPNILSDKYYDFNFQDFEYQGDEINFYPGDELITECHYDTTSRTSITTFGESTQQEMCLSFHIYYPRPKGNVYSLCAYGNYTGMEGVPAPYNTSVLTCGNITYFNIPPINLTIPLPQPTCQHINITTNLTTPIIRDISYFNTSSYQRQLYLDGDDIHQYSLWWNVDRIQQMIHFAIDVDVDGWVGLGFSPTGGMINSDVITSWLSHTQDGSCNNYTGHVEDLYATAHALPPLDTYQDIFNIVFYVKPCESPSSSSGFSTNEIIAISTGSGLVLIVIIACIWRKIRMKHDTTLHSQSQRLLSNQRKTIV